MTKPPNNPPPESSEPAEPGRALRIARYVIALGLTVGIAVFAVFTIEELKAGPPGAPPPTDFGAATPGVPALTPPTGNTPLPGLTGPDPTKFIPIVRDNPHPGEIVPYLDTAPLGQPPYRQPIAGEVWEFCVYERPNASINELVGYYARQAAGRGLKQVKLQPTSANTPGGIEAAWSDGTNRLEVTVRPLPAPRTEPPLAPPTPLRWVVKYSYPEKQAKP